MVVGLRVYGLGFRVYGLGLFCLCDCGLDWGLRVVFRFGCCRSFPSQKTLNPKPETRNPKP